VLKGVPLLQSFRFGRGKPPKKFPTKKAQLCITIGSHTRRAVNTAVQKITTPSAARKRKRREETASNKPGFQANLYVKWLRAGQRLGNDCHDFDSGVLWQTQQFSTHKEVHPPQELLF
jgi:hypothetical protein